MAQMGKWAFIVGFVICVVAGLLIAEAWMYWVLAVLGLIVGFMNITGFSGRRAPVSAAWAR